MKESQTSFDCSILRLLVPLIALSAVLVASQATADVFKYVDKRGQTHFSDRKPTRVIG